MTMERSGYAGSGTVWTSDSVCEGKLGPKSRLDVNERLKEHEGV